MALKKCLDCGKEVNNFAKICPHCGKKHPTSSSKQKFIAYFILIFLFYWVYSNFIKYDPDSVTSKTNDLLQSSSIVTKVEPINTNTNNKNINKQTSKKQESGTIPIQKPSEKQKIGKTYLGDTVINEDYGYTLGSLNVEDPTPQSTNSFLKIEIEQGYKLVAIEIVLGNVSGNVLNVNILNAVLVDNDGFVYNPELGAGFHKQIELADLSVGEKIKGWIAFTIPENSRPTTIKYNVGNVFSAKFITVGLTERE